MMLERIAVAVAALFVAAGCYDVNDSFDDFTKRDKELGRPAATPNPCAPKDPMPCERTEGMTRVFLLSVSTALAATKPTVQRAEITLIDGGNAMKIKSRAYAAIDRKTLVGPEAESPVIPLEPDGSFVTPEMTLDVDPAANPIIPGTPAKANVVLEGGFVCDDATFACGCVSGTLVEPIMQDLAGSTWSGQLIEDEANPPAPLLNCDRTAADPL